MFHAGLPEDRARFQQDERKDDAMRTYGDKTAAVRIQLDEVKQKIIAEDKPQQVIHRDQRLGDARWLSAASIGTFVQVQARPCHDHRFPRHRSR